MEKLNNEQTAPSAQTAEVEKFDGATEGEVSLGKFKDVKALLSAYGSLEAEFTKRCQRLKELETAIEKKDKEEPPKTQSAESEQENLTDTTLKEEILKDYLKEIIGSKKPVVMDGAGVGVKAPVKKPTTIEQAGDMFKELLSEKNK